MPTMMSCDMMRTSKVSLAGIFWGPQSPQLLCIKEMKFVVKVF